MSSLSLCLVMRLDDMGHTHGMGHTRGTKQGGLGGLNPPEFWMGGLNNCQPPLILRKNLGGGGWLPLN